MKLSILGIPSSAGANMPGSEAAPFHLRQCGLNHHLVSRGTRVLDYGDCDKYSYQPDPENISARNLKGAVVTGAGSGMGRATDLCLVSEGAKVVCLDLNEETAEATAQTICDKGGQGVSMACDVSKRDDLKKARDFTIKTFGKATHLVNSAGVLTMEGLSDMPEKSWDFVIDVNLKGTFLANQLFVPELVKAGGRSIVNISSIEAEVVVASGPQTQPHYAASKGGIKTIKWGSSLRTSPGYLKDRPLPSPPSSETFGRESDK